jgi:hypothetical protein
VTGEVPVPGQRLRHVMPGDGTDFEKGDYAKNESDAGESEAGEAIKRAGVRKGGDAIVHLIDIVIITATGMPKPRALRRSKGL